MELPAKPPKKPTDLWLGILGGFVLPILLYLFPNKTPAIVAGLLFVMFVVLIHPIWNFWWIEDYLPRRLMGIFCLAITLVVVGFNVPYEKAVASTEPIGPKEEPPPSTAALPLVLEFHVSNSRGPREKFITIVNSGGVGIEDVRIDGILYRFGLEGWKSHVLQLDFFSKLRQPLATVPNIGPGKNSKPIDMAKLPMQLHSWGESLSDSDDLMRTFYCLRFTFRDERTGEKYAAYKVTTDFYGSPSPIEDEVEGVGGFPGHRWIDDVPEIIRANCASFYKDQIKEYQP